jgi:hypothetical protein
MSIQTRIDEAVARHQVLYGSMPEKAVVPEKDLADLYPPRYQNGGVSFTMANGEVIVLPVSSGKVTDVMLFRKRAG